MDLGQIEKRSQRGLTESRKIRHEILIKWRNKDNMIKN